MYLVRRPNPYAAFHCALHGHDKAEEQIALQELDGKTVVRTICARCGLIMGEWKVED